MATPDTFQLWISAQTIPLAILATLLAAGFLLLYLSALRRRRALIRERAGHTEEGFVRHLATFGFDPAIARSTYRYLQDVQNVHFPILLHDALDEDLGLGTEDVDESRKDLLAANQRELRPGLRHEPLITVEDLIRFIQASPRRRDEAA
ncbi:hypothetical protein [Granulicella sibirica]|uniref:Uncharacterized protein n=1 Tax=Granulicella sibirica TaxID=2479048 RepID=A0A4V1L6D1_9BACT|nr:hypothetical protein [Granulicella sibirica]RXH58844.1 hypothetical protein GRAN_2154 [Granulicella sibirica]